MNELAADGIPVAVTCRVVNIARQPYYRWRAQPVTDTELGRAYRANVLFDAHRDDPEFGYRFLADEARDAGVAMADRTAWRICSSMGWWSAFGKKRGRNGKKTGPPVHDDLIRRDFTAAAPNRLWLAYITEHHTAEGKLYLCTVKDACSNRIVGYSIDSRMKSRLAVAALPLPQGSSPIRSTVFSSMPTWTNSSSRPCSPITPSAAQRASSNSRAEVTTCCSTACRLRSLATTACACNSCRNRP
ncbi:hypothetical protein ACVDFE_31545 [Lentzea chajnantorensis]